MYCHDMLNILIGGEKQRVSIARALLKEPKIMILDEATSSLDTETEKQILNALDENFMSQKGKFTVLSIAHRLSTVIDCDQILVLHNGSIAEAGTHEQLLKLDGLYSSMWQKQEKRTQLLEELDRSSSPMPELSDNNNNNNLHHSDSLNSNISIQLDPVNNRTESQSSATGNVQVVVDKMNENNNITNNNNHNNNNNKKKNNKNKNKNKQHSNGNNSTNNDLQQPLLSNNDDDDSDTDSKV